MNGSTPRRLTTLRRAIRGLLGTVTEADVDRIVEALKMAGRVTETGGTLKYWCPMAGVAGTSARPSQSVTANVCAQRSPVPAGAADIGGMMIYFCWASLEHTIYVMGGGVGFTRCTSKFVDAPTEGQACAAYRAFLEARGIRVRSVTGSVALHQDRKRYVFPEQILAAGA